MSVPVDEIDVGHDPRTRPPWHDWSSRRRRVAAVLAVVVLVAAGVVWFVVRGSGGPAPSPVASTPRFAAAPGADVVEQMPPDTSRCPATARCRYDDTIADGAQQAFSAAFGTGGFFARQTVVDARTGEVYWQYLRFATGTLVTVTLTQEPVSRLASPPVVDDDPGHQDLRNGAVTVSTVRGGYLVTANAAGLPGQTLPVAAVLQWLRTVPAP